MTDQELVESLGTASEYSIGIAARCWCLKETENITMDPVLAMAFAQAIDTLLNSNKEEQKSGPS